MSASRLLLVALILLQAGACPEAWSAPKAGKGDVHSVKTVRRIVHHFDFDERSEGNLEVLPRYWTPLHGEQFPRFSQGSFDDTVGRPSPPSFRIESMGRNAAFQYEGPEIPVRPESEYRIEGFLRTSGMSSARACVSAHFLDADRNPLLPTSRRTAYMAQNTGADWTVFELQLPAAPEGAEFLGLTAWILQDATWNLDQAGPHISLVDVGAGVWLDDISVYRLPRVEITTRSPGNILSGDDAALWITLADSLDEQVAGEMTLVSADGTEVMRHRLQGAKGTAGARRIELAGLPPGLYETRVEVVDQGSTIVSRSLKFLKLTYLGNGTNRQARAFGIVIDPENRADLQTEAALLTNHTVRSVKLPIMPERDVPGDKEKSGGRAFEQYYNELVRNQFSLTGVVSGFSTKLNSDSRPARDQQSGEPLDSKDSWESKIAAMSAPTASLFQFWQIGVDGQSIVDASGELKVAAQRLRTALQDYVTLPRMASPLVVFDQVTENKLPVEHVTLTLRNASDLWQLSERIKVLKEKGCEEVSAFAPPLPADRYSRQPRLAEWARRVLEARHAGAAVVYIPQPWGIPTTSQGGVVEPDETYLLSRTLAALLGDAKPGPVVPLAEHVRCLTFRGDNKAVVAIWDEAPPPEGRAVAIQLGAAGRQMDLWGRSTPLFRDEAGRQLVHVSAMPVLIDQADVSVIDFAASVSLVPAVVESGVELVHQEIVIDCPTAASMSGRGILIPPPGVEVSPRAFSFDASAGEPVRIPIQVRYAHNETAGKKSFAARITLTHPAYHFEIPMTIEVRMSDIEVSARATMERGDLWLRHTLHNRSHSEVSFRSIAGVPGRQRQYRPVPNLGPGETQTLEYRFPDGADLIGRRVNLTLRELNDGPRQHNLELIVP